MTTTGISMADRPRIASGTFADAVDRHPTKVATFASWGYQLVNIAAMAIIAPELLTRFGAADTGIWFFLLGCVTFFQLCDFGLAMSVSRQIAFSGKEPEADVLPEGSTFIPIYGPQARHEVFVTARRLFHWMACVFALLAVVAERTFLFAGRMATTTEVRATWYLVVFAGLGYFLTRPYQVYLEGLLIQSWERLMVFLITIGQNVALLAAIVLWPRLWVMGVAFAFGGWLQYLCTVWLARRAVPAELWRLNASRAGLSRLLWGASWEQGVTSLGTYLVISINPLLIGWLMGPSGVAEYYLPWRAVTAAQTALIAIFLPHLPFMIEQVRQGEHEVVKRRFKRLFIIGMGLALLGYGAFVAVGPRLLAWWLHGEVPVSRAVLLSLALWQILGVLQTICWLYIVAYGIQRFAHSIIAGAILNVVFSIWMIPRFGVLGSVIATTVAQLLTSNWYTAWRALTLWRGLGARSGASDDHMNLGRNVLAEGAAT